MKCLAGNPGLGGYPQTPALRNLYHRRYLARLTSHWPRRSQWGLCFQTSGSIFFAYFMSFSKSVLYLFAQIV